MLFLALCPLGVEKVLKDEIKNLGLVLKESASGKVFFEGSWEAVYKTNLHLRTAERVMVVLGKFSAVDFDAFFQGVRSLPWEDWLNPRCTIVIDKVKSYKSKLTSIPALQASAQKAVFDRLCGAWGLRTLPQAGAKVGIRLYLEFDKALVCLDTTGPALHNRGYRQGTGEAPIKENLAASLFFFSGWRRKYPLYDPLCGSGTILSEALLYAFNIAPGHKRDFSFEHLDNFNALDWQLIKDEARDNIDMSCRVRVCGSDKDSRVLDLAYTNFKALGIHDRVKLEVLSMEEARAELVDGWEAGEPGFLITNPPYGERLETREHAENLSRQMRHFEKSFPGWKIGVLTSLPDFPQQINRKPYVVRDMMNGAIPVKYYQFE